MAKFTPNYNLELPAYNEFYNIDIENTNFQKVDDELELINAAKDTLITNMISSKNSTLNRIFGDKIYLSPNDKDEIILFDDDSYYNYKDEINRLCMSSLEKRINGEDNIVKDIESDIKDKLTIKDLTNESKKYDILLSELENECNKLWYIFLGFEEKCNIALKKLEKINLSTDTDRKLSDYIDSVIKVISGAATDLNNMDIDKCINNIIDTLQNSLDQNGFVYTGRFKSAYDRYQSARSVYFKNVPMVKTITGTSTDNFNNTHTTYFDEKYKVIASCVCGSTDDIYDPTDTDNFWDESVLTIITDIPFLFGNKIINGNMKYSIELNETTFNNLFSPIQNVNEDNDDYNKSEGYLIVRYIQKLGSDYHTYDINRKNRKNNSFTMMIVSELPKYSDEYCILCKLKINSKLKKGDNVIECDISGISTYNNSDFGLKNLTDKIYDEYEYYMLGSTDDNGIADENSSVDYEANLYDARTNGTKNDGKDPNNTDPIDESYKFRDEVYLLDYYNPQKLQMNEIINQFDGSKDIIVCDQVSHVSSGIKIDAGFKNILYDFLSPNKHNIYMYNQTDKSEEDLLREEYFPLLYYSSDYKDITIGTIEENGQTKNVTYFSNFINKLADLGFHTEAGYKYYQERIDYFSKNISYLPVKIGNVTLIDPEYSNQNINLTVVTNDVGLMERFICTGSSGNKYNDIKYKNEDYYNIGECYDILMCRYTLYNEKNIVTQVYAVNLLTGEILNQNIDNHIYRISSELGTKYDYSIFVETSIDENIDGNSDLKNLDPKTIIKDIHNYSSFNYFNNSYDYVETNKNDIIKTYGDEMLKAIDNRLEENKNKNTITAIKPVNVPDLSESVVTKS